jgi:Domain of unknown function (DUF4349)
VSQPDLLTRLRAARPVAPPQLREHVRLLAAQAAPPRRRVTWRRAFVVLVPVTAAVVAGAVLLSGGSRTTAVPKPIAYADSPAANTGAAFGALQAPKHPPTTLQKSSSTESGLPAPSGTRAQQYTASLGLRVKNADAVSDVTKQAVRIAQSLGGHLTSVNVEAEGRSGYATLVLRVPIGHVRQAVSQLSALGTIVGESVAIKDLQGQVDATAQKVRRLQRLVVSWRALPQTAETIKHIDALVSQIERLKRARAATVRTASLATIHLQLTSRQAPQPLTHPRGPLHQLGVIFRSAGIVAVYVLALGAPIVALFGIGWLVSRSVRRRREDRLLASP